MGAVRVVGFWIFDFGFWIGRYRAVSVGGGAAGGRGRVKMVMVMVRSGMWFTGE